MAKREMSLAGGCECGSGKAYAACCGAWHLGANAPTPEALMRSRYSAFVRQDEPYLLRTWHLSTRPASVPFTPQIKWLGLTVQRVRQSVPGHAEVTFVARYRIGGASAQRLQECSRFVLEAGQWFYLDGEGQD